jgi:hypothetical protein
MKSPLTKSEVELRSAAEKAVRECVSDIPGVTIELEGQERLVGNGITVDWLGTIQTKKQTRPLIIEFKRSGQPNFAREAVNMLLRSCRELSNSYGIFVAPFISEESGKILAAEQIGFIDFAGNCLISFDDVYIRREGRSNPFTEKRDLRSLYSPKAEHVLRVLMAEPRKAWKVAPLAKEAGVSLGQVSNIKKLLDAREWTRRGPQGFSLTEPGKLLAEWAQAYPRRTPKTVECYAQESLAEIERRVAGPEVPGVLTAFSAAARVAPAVRYQRVTAYAPQGAETLIVQLKLKGVSSGGNLLLIEPYDDGVFIGAQERDGVKFVSPLQAYLDLQYVKGRGQEAAEAILQGALEPSW